MPAKKSVPASQVRKEGKPMAATENNYSKVIISDKEGNKYTLEFNARVIKNMERRGFQLNTDFPYTMIDDLFLGAFQMHHKGITPEKAKAIWAQQTKKDDLLGVLTKLYMKPLEDLMAEPEGDEETETPTWETD